MEFLKEGIYEVPCDCSIKREGRVITVYKTVRKRLSPTEYRCKDCVHRVMGLNTYWKTFVCELRPKPQPKQNYRQERFYACREFDKPCERFELKISEQ